MSSRLWYAYLTIGIVSIAAYPFVPSGPWQDLAYLALGASCVAAIGCGVLLHRPPRRAPWFAMMAGQSLWVIGDAVDSWNVDVAHLNVFPSVADIFYLSAYPFLALGLLLLIRGRRPRRDWAGLLDSATLTAGLGLLSWVLIAHPTVVAAQQSVAAAAVGVAYPVADILLVGLLIRLVTTPGGRTPAFRFLFVAVVLLIAGDTASAGLSLFWSGSTDVFDILWLGSYVLWGAAALHPSMRSLSTPTSDSDPRFTRGRLAALTLATLVAPGVLTAQALNGGRIDVWAVATGSVVLVLLVLGRMSVTIDQIVATNRVRERLQEDLEYQAAHDSLTGLPNRAQMIRLIDAAISRPQCDGGFVGLLFVDLDGFKTVNDTRGHRAGDDVLRSVAKRLQSGVRDGDIVARLGGDEFVVLLESVLDEPEAIRIANRLIEVLSEPSIAPDGSTAAIGASIGVTVSRGGETDADRMLYEADTAVYRAKAAGRGRVEIFDDTLRRELAERDELEAAITKAIADDELQVHYQPILNLGSGAVTGYEALVRWDRPGVGLVPPVEFIPVAETSGLICDLDTWVLRHATKQLAQWRTAAAAADRLSVAVNISGRHVSSDRIVNDVAEALRDSGICARDLVLEITETGLTDGVSAIRHLEQLRTMGVTVCIDDFGTGYSSIARMQELPIDFVKIDKSFLDPAGRGSLHLLELMVAAAHAVGLPVVAEGVESQDQVGILESINCDSVQGFLFARPMSADAAANYLAEHRPGTAQRAVLGPTPADPSAEHTQEAIHHDELARRRRTTTVSSRITGGGRPHLSTRARVLDDTSAGVLSDE